MRKTVRSAARTVPAHEALLRETTGGLLAEVARLALRVLRARLDGRPSGPHVISIRVILFRAAALLNLLAKRVVPAPRPVLPLTSRAAVASLASTALLGSFGVQRRCAGGAGREEVHFSVDS